MPLAALIPLTVIALCGAAVVILIAFALYAIIRVGDDDETRDAAADKFGVHPDGLRLDPFSGEWIPKANARPQAGMAEPVGSRQSAVGSQARAQTPDGFDDASRCYAAQCLGVAPGEIELTPDCMHWRVKAAAPECRRCHSRLDPELPEDVPATFVGAGAYCGLCGERVPYGTLEIVRVTGIGELAVCMACAIANGKSEIATCSMCGHRLPPDGTCENCGWTVSDERSLVSLKGHPGVAPPPPAVTIRPLPPIQMLECRFCGEPNPAAARECRRCRSRLEPELPDRCPVRMAGGCIRGIVGGASVPRDEETEQ
jgi:ribosomal protein L40E